VCRECANSVIQNDTERYGAIIDQREILMNQHRKELTRTERNKLIKTTNQGVACSNHAGCTSDINHLRQGLGSAALLCLQWHESSCTCATT
jgi:hypothetical protein